MGLITETVWVTVNGNNIKHYKDLGYNIPNRIDKYGKVKAIMGSEFQVKTIDLPNNSMIRVNCMCDNCHNISNITYGNYKKSVKNGKTFCIKCASILYGSENSKKTKLKKSISLYQWCITNNKQKILEKWDYKLNNCSPHDVSYNSTGIDGKGFWFKCLNNINHKSEQRRITYLTRNNNALECKQCNSFAQYIINKYGESIYEKIWSNKNTVNPFNITYGSKEKIYLICPNCNNDVKISPNQYIRQGLSCPICSDGISYPEKFVYNLLEQLKDKNKINVFERQKSFDWSKYNESKNPKLNGKKIYDFYIDNFKGIIIETHGAQHYGHIMYYSVISQNPDEIKENDIIKKNIAKPYIENYVPLDCSKSNLNYIKKSIMESKLPKLIGFNEYDINWITCHKYALSSLVNQACDMWNNNIQNVREISKSLNVHYDTVQSYLKKGSLCGRCNYDPLEERKKSGRIKLYYKDQSKKIICTTTKIIYNSIKYAQTKIGVSSIYGCCQGKCKSAGKLPDGTHLHWQYLDEYMQQNGYTDSKDIPGVTIYEENNT